MLDWTGSWERGEELGAAGAKLESSTKQSRAELGTVSLEA